MTKTKKIAILGGGIVGLVTAYSLAAEKHEVVVIDKDPFTTSSCSFGNAGYICPSRIMPLSSPGMIFKGLMWMFNHKSPFSINLKPNRHLLHWLWIFRKMTKPEKVHSNMKLLCELGIGSSQLFIKMCEDISFALHKKGLILLYQTHHGIQEAKNEIDAANKLGIESILLNRKDIEQYLPNVEVEALGGAYYPGDMHVAPHEIIAALRKKLHNQGVKFIKGEALEFTASKERIDKVHLAETAISADEFVLCAGSWSPLLGKKLSLFLPLQPGKGYSFQVEVREQTFLAPVLLAERKVAVTPMGNELRIAGTLELGEMNLNIDPRRIEGITEAFTAFFPKIRISNQYTKLPWTGLRPCSPDGLPYIGRFSTYSNLIAATGHSMLGLSLAAITGKLVTDLVNEKSLGQLAEPLHPQRFSR